MLDNNTNCICCLIVCGQYWVKLELIMRVRLITDVTFLNYFLRKVTCWRTFCAAKYDFIPTLTDFFSESKAKPSPKSKDSLLNLLNHVIHPTQVNN